METVTNSLEVFGSTLRCKREKGESSSHGEEEIAWSIEIGDIVLVAECTTNEGPWLDDYFFVFVTIEDGKQYRSQCTFYADGSSEALESMGLQLGAPLRPGLCHSTEWTSRVMWPTHIEGIDYFDFTQVKPVGLISRLSKVFFGPQSEYSVAEPVREYLREASHQARVQRP